MKKLATALLMLLLVFGLGMTVAPDTVCHAAAATTKNGLKKENGKYYYYKNGTKVKNTLKSVTVSDGTKAIYYFGSNGAAIVNTLKTIKVDGVSCRYYFGSNGKAYKNKWKTITSSAGKSYRYYFASNGRAITDKVKTINGYKYGFDSNSRMVTGVQVFNDKFYFFNSSGKMNSTKTTKLRKASADGTDYRTTLKKLLKTYGVKLKKTINYGRGCGNGIDYAFVYQGFTVSVTVKDDTGSYELTGVERGEAEELSDDLL
ncbi:MAG: hypothetical protein LUI07_10390 [Lachnospiraceae bacterium]|nr:hypothetical protein [Lachnospiraceae bacterium]